MKYALLVSCLLLASPVTAQSPPSVSASGTGGIVQIAFTYADVPAKDLSRLGNLWTALSGASDALGAAQALAESRHVSMTLIPAQAVVTADGLTGQIQSTKRIPYGGHDMYGYNFAIVSGFSVTPGINADSTITAHIVLKQSKRERPRPGDGKQSVTSELNVDTTCCFRPGDTLLIAGPLSDVVPPRFVFATVTILPLTKGELLH